MRIVVIRCIIIYFSISTFLLINLLFNKNMKLGRQNAKTGEFRPSPMIEILKFCIFWIIMIPKIIINNKKLDKFNKE